MFRPTHPRVMNNIYQNRTPYNSHWRPNYRPRAPPPLQWRNRGPEHFGASVTEPGNREEHWCETCDRGFPTLDILERHKQQHQKCNIDGCQFVAHPKVITKHIQMQHSSGLYKKIAKLANPEEIQKWREERKKKYPTRSNIEKKAAECKEKIERGEKMALRNENGNNRHRLADGRVGFKRKPNFDRGNQRQNRPTQSNIQNENTKDTKTHPPPKKMPKTLPIAEQKRKLIPFTGIMSIEMDEKVEDCMETLESNHLIEDEDYENVAPKEHSDKQKPVICSALSSLMCEYGSSDDETAEAKEKKVVSDTVDTINESTVVPNNDNHMNDTEFYKTNIDNSLEQNKLISKQSSVGQIIDDKAINLMEGIVNPINESKLTKSDDDSGPEEIKIDKAKEIVCTQDQIAKCSNGQKSTVGSTSKQKYNHGSVNRQRSNYKSKHKIPSTLLQKLLSTEIRRERNLVLQCIRYVKKNNYFVKTQN